MTQGTKGTESIILKLQGQSEGVVRDEWRCKMFTFILAIVVWEDPDVHKGRAFTTIPLIMRTLNSKADTLKNIHISTYRKPM